MERFMKSMALALCLLVTHAYAVNSDSESFNFDGTLADSAGVPITSQTSVKFGIYNPSGTCLLFEETHSITPDAQGNFSVRIGKGTFTSGSQVIAWPKIFTNGVQVVSSGTGCAAGYTSTATDMRYLRVTIGGTALTPDFPIGAVPMATVAETLQGKVPADFLLTSASSTLSAPLTFGTGSEARFGTASTWVGFRAGSPSGQVVWTLPNTDGSSGQCLTTSGSGTLAWSTCGGGGGITTAGGAFTGAVTLNPSAQTNTNDAATRGYVDSSVTNLDASSITSGTLNPARLPSGLITSAGGSFTGAIAFTSNGTPATPLVGFPSGAGGAGIFAPTNDFIGFATSGSSRMIIASNGSVGIGTTAPTEKLHISDPSIATMKISNVSSALTLSSMSGESLVSSPNADLYLSGGGSYAAARNYILLANSAYGVEVNSGSGSQPIKFKNNGVERMIIDASGNVGVGTVAPAAKLDVLTATNEPVASFNQNYASASGPAVLLKNQSFTAPTVRIDNLGGGPVLQLGMGSEPIREIHSFTITNMTCTGGGSAGATFTCSKAGSPWTPSGAAATYVNCNTPASPWGSGTGVFNGSTLYINGVIGASGSLSAGTVFNCMATSF